MHYSLEGYMQAAVLSISLFAGLGACWRIEDKVDSLEVLCTCISISYLNIVMMFYCYLENLLIKQPFKENGFQLAFQSVLLKIFM